MPKSNPAHTKKRVVILLVVYVDENFVRVINTSGKYDFTYVKHEGQLVAQKNPDGTKYFYHPDHLGSTTLVTDGNANAIENTTYEPFGAEVSGGNLDVKGYTGQFDDSATGQYYYGARYYVPGRGQFISGDPELKVYDSQQLNHYSYARNNPYLFTDPEGKKVKEYHVDTRQTFRVGKRDGGITVIISVPIKEITYKVKGGQKQTLYLTQNAYNQLESQATQRSLTSYSAWSSFTRNMQQEYMVSYLENLQGRQYEPRSMVQRVVQIPGGRIGMTAAGAVGGGPFGGAGVAAYFGRAELQEKEVVGGEIVMSDFAEVGADILVGGIGGGFTKGVASAIAGQTVEHVVIDIASEVGAGVVYESGKNIINEEEGG